MFFSGLRNLLGSLFQSADEQSSHLIPTSHYDEHLIDSLLDDHQRLLKHYSRMVDAVTRRDSKRFHVEISDFGSAIKTHVAKEKAKFYVYIQNKHKSSMDESKRIIHFRTEMEQIMVVITRFLNKYTLEEQTDTNWAELPHKLSELAAALSKRLHDEETDLYKMYVK